MYFYKLNDLNFNQNKVQIDFPQYILDFEKLSHQEQKNLILDVAKLEKEFADYFDFYSILRKLQNQQQLLNGTIKCLDFWNSHSKDDLIENYVDYLYYEELLDKTNNLDSKKEIQTYLKGLKQQTQNLLNSKQDNYYSYDLHHIETEASFDKVDLFNFDTYTKNAYMQLVFNYSSALYSLDYFNKALEEINDVKQAINFFGYLNKYPYYDLNLNDVLEFAKDFSSIIEKFSLLIIQKILEKYPNIEVYKMVNSTNPNNVYDENFDIHKELSKIKDFSNQFNILKEK
ncbi:hypothetical protein GE118_00400 [Mycoplasma sp. NEAQ87857]|uniref:hypothetical protein n=1 Tax=Mycoplasma sp. NEAQ87857 TaxID=2683967 RepID=UPI001319B357|nr:hypothetical protein [Mycoplasma sp. NEAQ87857]QGZ97264.1 hypothetical protein GE118_00400 [Mycoplasma sp. NEAQ87857]